MKTKCAKNKANVLQSFFRKFLMNQKLIKLIVIDDLFASAQFNMPSSTDTETMKTHLISNSQNHFVIPCLFEKLYAGGAVLCCFTFLQ